MPERGPGCQGGSGAPAPDVPLGRMLRGLFAGGVCGAAAHGLRLNVAAGTAVRFEPGIPVDVELVPLAGRRIVPGLPTRAGNGPYARVTVVGVMSAPLYGDRLAVEAWVGDGARLTVGSVAATIALPGPGPGPNPPRMTSS